MEELMQRKLDWPTFSALCERTLSAIDGREFVRVIVDTTGTVLVLINGEAIILPVFRCGGGEALEAHFTARVLERAGLGTFSKLRPLLSACDELLAFRRADGSYSIYTHTRGSPHPAPKE